MKNRVTVLDVGSASVAALIGERGINNTITVLGKEDRLYEGFSENRFFDEDGFKKAAFSAVKSLSENVKSDVKKIYVGVPGAFVRIENRKFKIAYKKKKKIKRSDIDELFEAGKAAVKTEGYEIISYSDAYFVLDDNRKVFDPAGNVSSVLGGNLTYVLADGYFTEAVRSSLSDLRIEKIKFVFEGQAEWEYLSGGKSRGVCSLIADVGYITSCFSVVSGNGIIASESFDYGGGMISATLAERFKIDFGDAEKLKSQISFGNSEISGFYTVKGQSGELKFPIKEVHGIVKKCISETADMLDGFVGRNSDKIRSALDIYLTGGGITDIRGAAEYFAALLDTAVEVVSPAVQGYSHPVDFSAISLLDHAFGDNSKLSIFDFFDGGKR